MSRNFFGTDCSPYLLVNEDAADAADTATEETPASPVTSASLSSPSKPKAAVSAEAVPKKATAPGAKPASSVKNVSGSFYESKYHRTLILRSFDGFVDPELGEVRFSGKADRDRLETDHRRCRTGKARDYQRFEKTVYY